MPVTLNPAQKLYVIQAGRGYACLGFDVLERRAVALSRWLVSVDKAFSIAHPAAWGTLERYAQYESMLSHASDYCLREHTRCPCELTPALIGKEGKRVEITAPSGEKTRFIVGKSMGWMPCHLEIARRNASGGPAVYWPEGATVRVIA
jgi:hypothetical protein